MNEGQTGLLDQLGRLDEERSAVDKSTVVRRERSSELESVPECSIPIAPSRPTPAPEQDLSWESIGLGSALASSPAPSAQEHLSLYLYSGAKIGRFALIERLGIGSMSEVWRARENSGSLSREVAVKFIRPRTEKSGAGRLYRNEVRVNCRLGYHDGILNIMGCGAIELAPTLELQWLSMPLVSGGRTLRELLNQIPKGSRRGPAYFTRVARLFEKLALGLQHAHDRGVIHRDLKPENVLLTREDEPKIADFGLARIVDDPECLAGRVGTMAYMSPEHADGEACELSDQFSLGSMLYEFLALDRPFHGSSARELLENVCRANPLDPRRLRRRVPGALAAICRKAMSRNSGERYANAAAMARDLRRFIDHHPVQAAPSCPIRCTAMWVRRHPAAASWVFLLSIAASVLSSIANAEPVAAHERAEVYAVDGARGDQGSPLEPAAPDRAQPGTSLRFERAGTDSDLGEEVSALANPANTSPSPTVVSNP